MSWRVAPDLGVVTQPYGCTSFSGEWRVGGGVCSTGFFHAGIDLSEADCCDKPLFATRDGVVEAVGGFPGSVGLGPNAVCIRTDEGPFLIYGHCSSAHVQPGQRINAGQHIADVGTLGFSTGCHLHFEVRTELGTVPPQGMLDPGQYLDFGGPPPPPDTEVTKTVSGPVLRDAPWYDWSSLSPIGQTVPAGTGVTYTQAKRVRGVWYDRIARGDGTPGDWCLRDDDINTGGTTPDTAVPEEPSPESPPSSPSVVITVTGRVWRDAQWVNWSDAQPIGQTAPTNTGVTYSEARQVGGRWLDRITKTDGSPGDWALWDDDVDTGGKNPEQLAAEKGQA
jgi:hypothetical protein